MLGVASVVDYESVTVANKRVRLPTPFVDKELGAKYRRNSILVVMNLAFFGASFLC